MTTEGQKMDFPPLRRPDANFADLGHPDHNARRFAHSALSQGRHSRTPDGLFRSLAHPLRCEFSEKPKPLERPKLFLHVAIIVGEKMPQKGACSFCGERLKAVRARVDPKIPVNLRCQLMCLDLPVVSKTRIQRF